MPGPDAAGTSRGAQRIMARSMWRGAIQFGLVTIPVRLYLATESRGISFNMLHQSCLSRIQMKTYCPHHDEVISRGDTVKGFEYAKDQYVVITEEDLASVPLKTVRSIEIEKFVPALPQDDEPARFVKQAYYVEPEAIGKKAYALLREVLAEQDLAAICKVVIKDREALAALNPQGSAMVLETLHWPDEIRATDELDLPGEEIEVKPAERAMAAQLIAAMTGAFDPAEYRDEYRAALEEVIDAKVQGREIVEPEAPAAGGQLVDLMAMLEASVSAARTARSNRETEEAAEEEAIAGAGVDRGAGRGTAGRSKKAAVPVEEIEEREAPARKVARRKSA
jgi:DNA end-binding protein Ku